MTRALAALLLAGCLQGGAMELDGTWITAPDRSRCAVVVTLGPGPAYASDRVCPCGVVSPRRGTYAEDGQVLHVVDDTGAFDLHWWFDPHGDVLLLDGQRYGRRNDRE